MSEMSQVRRLAALVCLVLVLLAALAPGPVGLPPSILIILAFLKAIALSVLLPNFEEQIYTQQSPALPAFSPRPPPAQ
jgi:hypothetical protein